VVQGQVVVVAVVSRLCMLLIQAEATAVLAVLASISSAVQSKSLLSRSRSKRARRSRWWCDPRHETLRPDA
jgi:hypothetical protein